MKKTYFIQIIWIGVILSALLFPLFIFSTGDNSIVERHDEHLKSSQGLFWEFMTSGDVSSSPALADLDEDGKLEVVVGSEDGKLYALNGEDGTELWNYTTESSIDGCSPALGDVDGNGKIDVIVGSNDHYLYAVHGNNGSFMWKYDTRNAVQSTPCIGDLNGDGMLEVVVGNRYDGRICALYGENGTEMWTYMTNYIIASSPALGDINNDGQAEVVAGSADNSVYALYGNNGTLLWKYTCGDTIWGSSSTIADIDGDGKHEVVIGSYDRKVHVINGEDGTWCWNFTTGYRISRSSPAIGDIDGDGKLEVVIGSDDHVLYALDGDGTQIWNYTTGDSIFSSPSLGDVDGDGKLEAVFGSRDNRIYALNVEDGTLSWIYTTAGDVDSSPVLADLDDDGKLEVVVGSNDNKVYAINPVSSGNEVVWQALAGIDFLRTKFIEEVTDAIDPVLLEAPNDSYLEYGTIGAILTWIAIDSHPFTYTINLEGVGIVAGPTVWQNNTAIKYVIPGDLDIGQCVYSITITDFLGNFVTDNVIVTVEDTTNPVLIDTTDFFIECGYTGVSISWYCTDPYPANYTINLEGVGLVAGPLDWESGSEVIYNIPDGFPIGQYIYIVNFTDEYGNSVTDSVTIIVEDTTDPLITETPSDLFLEENYLGVNVFWMAMDFNPGTYTIELEGSGIVAGPTAWSSGTGVTYQLPEDLMLGEHVYTINLTDTEGNFVTDSVVITVEDTTNPVITEYPSDFRVEKGYKGLNITWIATDLNPGTYIIELQGVGIVSGPIAWSSGSAIIYFIPEDLAVGSHFYIINITDSEGNSIIHSVTITVFETAPFPFLALLFGSTIGGAAVIGVILYLVIRKKKS